MSKVVAGQKVKFRCHSFLSDGTSLDDPEDNEPMVMAAGHPADDPFVQSISDALIGMEKGEVKKLTLKPRNAFGAIDKKKVMDVARSNLPKGAKVGDVVYLDEEEDSQEATIKAIDGKTVTLDFNHPLAGQSIVIEIEVLSLRKK